MQPPRTLPGSALAKGVAVSTGPDEEFDGFMRGRWPAMVRLAYALTGDAGHAEDLAQTAFARAYASWGRVRRAGDPDAYVRRIVINTHRSRFRKHRVSIRARRRLRRPAAHQRRRLRTTRCSRSVMEARQPRGRPG